MADLKNELVWSHSRSKTFEGCPRAYWLTYYGSWGGWAGDAPAEVRAAYVQKKLTSRAMWIGTVVHGLAEEGLARARQGRPMGVEEAIGHARRRAREDVDGSASGWWLGRPAKRVGFREHYYGEAVTDADWAAAVAEIERQVAALHEHRIWKRLMSVPDRILEVEELRRFRVGDGEIYVALDVLVDDGRGGVVIIDWKTGEAHSDEVIAAQLGVYGLYATQELGVDATRIQALHVNVRHATETKHPVGPAEIEAARETIGRTLAEMRAKLRSVPENLADVADYPPVEEGDGRCRRCSFRRTCGREERPI